MTQCAWCGVGIAEDDGFRASQPGGHRRAAYCRLEHVVPWAMQGPRWDRGTWLRPDDDPDGLGRCTHCGDPLGGRRVILVRHRGEHRIGDAFCGVDHLLEWARAGGRWAPRPRG